jgi:hypothetical protein
MNVEPNLASLQRHHRALEQELAVELEHPSADPLRIAELKRRKLRVKDQIAELSSAIH